MIQREKYEWMRVWFDDNNNPNGLKRILLIGDSITAGYRDFVQTELKGSYLVDMLATSRAVDNPSFYKELSYVLDEYTYALIHFNNGIHGRHLELSRYETGYRLALNMLLDKCPNVILTASTPITANNSAELLPEVNDMVTERNVVIRKIAEENGLAVDDLYTPMIGRPEWRAGDGYHYNEAGRQAQARLVAAAILSHPATNA